MERVSKTTPQESKIKPPDFGTWFDAYKKEKNVDFTPTQTNYLLQFHNIRWEIRFGNDLVRPIDEFNKRLENEEFADNEDFIEVLTAITSRFSH